MSERPTVSSLHELVAYVRAASDELKNNLWWRGQGSVEWPLVPGVFREDRGFAFERNASRIFIQRARSRRSACPSDTDASGWLFLMQHYGLPTRLLDWSESPLVALFFALANDSSPGALYALSPFALNQQHHGSHLILGTNVTAMRDMIAPVFKDTGPTKHKVAAIVADEIDLRMLTQLTAFTLHTTQDALEKDTGAKDWLRCAVIPAEAKKALQADLWRYGVRRSMLFPDLQNLARDLREKTYTEPK